MPMAVLIGDYTRFAGSLQVTKFARVESPDQEPLGSSLVGRDNSTPSQFFIFLDTFVISFSVPVMSQLFS